jgi:glycine betaine/proline transport system ATP-binding protein
VSLASLEEAKRADANLEQALLPDGPTVTPDISLNDLMGVVATTPYAVPVVQEDGRYVGAVSKSTLLKALDNINGDEPLVASEPTPAVQPAIAGE